MWPLLEEDQQGLQPLARCGLCSAPTSCFRCALISATVVNSLTRAACGAYTCLGAWKCELSTKRVSAFRATGRARRRKPQSRKRKFDRRTSVCGTRAAPLQFTTYAAKGTGAWGFRPRPRDTRGHNPHHKQSVAETRTPFLDLPYPLTIPGVPGAVQVFESRPDNEHSGAAVGLSVNGLRALEAIHPSLAHRWPGLVRAWKPACVLHVLVAPCTAS